MRNRHDSCSRYSDAESRTDHEQHPIHRPALRALTQRAALPPPAGVRRAGRSRSGSCPARHLADAPPPLPEVGEIDLVRHFTNLSARNMSIDTNFYPLGSCTMKYNPKRHERLAGVAGLRQPAPACRTTRPSRACWNCSSRCRSILAEIAGLPAVSLQPAAGAQGELTALLRRRRVLPRPGRAAAHASPRPRHRPRHQPRQRRSPASTPSPSRATRTAWSISTT